MADAHPLEGLEGKTLTITPKDGTAPYAAVVRSIHETGVTLWVDGGVRTVHLISVKNGQQADADYTVA